MPVDTPHPLYVKTRPVWQKINDCYAGEDVIKAAGKTYLPEPAEEKDKTYAKKRYDNYVMRAIFLNYTAATVDNSVGLAFKVDPAATLPDLLEPMLDNVNGAGVTAKQQAKLTLKDVVKHSRAALFTDYPVTAGQTTRADLENGKVRPKIITLGPLDFINWDFEEIGAERKLSLLVIPEDYTVSYDGFTKTCETQYRALRLIDGVYTVEIWRKAGGDSQHNGVAYNIAEAYVPTDASGKPFDEIPAVIIGAEANNGEVEKSHMIDIVNLNLGHYRNSADHEEASYICGQPTPILTGLTDDWVKTHLGNEVRLGSRSIIPLPQGGDGKLLQANANTVPAEGMKVKELQMVALGAKITEQKTVEKTATEAGIDDANTTSPLAAMIGNVNDAYSRCFQWAARFVGAEVKDPKADCVYEISTDFAVAKMSSDARSSIINLYTAGLIVFEEARTALRADGVAYLDDEQAKEQLQAQADTDLANAKKQMAAEQQVANGGKTEEEPSDAE